MSEEMNLKGVVSCNWKDIKAEEAAPGITQRILWEGNNGKRVEVYEFEAGAAYPGLDVHEPGPEQVYVISGIYNDGSHHYKAGDFINYPIASSHSPQSENGCVLLVNFPEG